MKTENLPIKLECFASNKSGRRELIGFLIVLMRSISDKATTKVRVTKCLVPQANVNAIAHHTHARRPAGIN